MAEVLFSVRASANFRAPPSIVMNGVSRSFIMRGLELFDENQCLRVCARCASSLGALEPPLVCRKVVCNVVKFSEVALDLHV